MSYIECRFKISPFNPFQEILLAHLAELGFESFSEEEPFLLAYIRSTDFDKSLINELELLDIDEVEIQYEVKKLPKENWNKKWESSFEPVRVGDFCLIRAPFHQSENNFTHEIIIEPKMSFGTGHHETTQLMIKQMAKLSLKGKAVLDMGSGTGVLTILAKKMGATEVTAIDIEEWAFENMQENFERNHVQKVNLILGGQDELNSLDQSYDIILANINKNILLEQLETYLVKLKENGKLILSGFFPSDVDDFENHLKHRELSISHRMELGQWACIMLD